jgi:hypothetical protein
MCADPRSNIWRRRDTDQRPTVDTDVWSGQGEPGEADGGCEGPLPIVTDSQQMESDDHDH